MGQKFKPYVSKKENKLHILKVICKNPKPIAEGLQELIDIIEKLEEEYEVRIWSDNAKFDIGMINTYLGVYLDHPPLNTTASGGYRRTYDITQYCRGYQQIPVSTKKSECDKLLSISKVDKDIEESGVKHDHFPEHDAEYICKWVCGIDRYVETKKFATK